VETPVREAREASPSPQLIAKAQAAVDEFRPDCFWFWHPDAKIRNRSDIKNAIRHLREYGGWKAWYTAQELQKCL
jgi:hypothetical protein